MNEGDDLMSMPPNQYGLSYPTVKGRRVLFKFREDLHVDIPYEDGIEYLIEELGLGSWSELEGRVPRVRRLFRTLEPEKMRKTRALVREISPDHRSPNFLTYFSIQTTSLREAERVVRVLRQWDSIEKAYIESPPAPDPAQPTGSNPQFEDQWHLKSSTDAADGVGAIFAWEYQGGQGEEQLFADIERGWQLDHPELLDEQSNPRVQHFAGENVLEYRSHGTAVLGILLAQDNDLGGVGLARSSRGLAISYMSRDESDDWTVNIPDALRTACDNLPPGSVMLIEAQIHNPQNPNAAADEDYLPVEADPFCFDVIAEATAKGITVIEAAGNSANNLDNWHDDQGNFFLRQGVRDSLAVIVGSAVVVDGANGKARQRWPTSNYGTRIDNFASGEQISTIDNANFGATSGAAAIVAGVALIIQGFCTVAFNCRLKPLALRQLLRQFGTASHNPAVDKIGVMPDLRQIIGVLQAQGVAPADQLP